MTITSVSFQQATQFIFDSVAIRVDCDLLTYPADLENDDNSFYFDYDNYDESDRTTIMSEDNEMVEYNDETGCFIFIDTEGNKVSIQGLRVAFSK